jgi:hypothetical protein
LSSSDPGDSGQRAGLFPGVSVVVTSMPRSFSARERCRIGTPRNAGTKPKAERPTASEALRNALSLLESVACGKFATLAAAARSLGLSAPGSMGPCGGLADLVSKSPEASDASRVGRASPRRSSGLEGCPSLAPSRWRWLRRCRDTMRSRCHRNLQPRTDPQRRPTVRARQFRPRTRPRRSSRQRQVFPLRPRHRPCERCRQY